MGLAPLWNKRFLVLITESCSQIHIAPRLSCQHRTQLICPDSEAVPGEPGTERERERASEHAARQRMNYAPRARKQVARSPARSPMGNWPAPLRCCVAGVSRPCLLLVLLLAWEHATHHWHAPHGPSIRQFRPLTKASKQPTKQSNGIASSANHHHRRPPSSRWPAPAAT